MELSIEQQYAFEKFKRGENVFMTGPGGSGKTELIRRIVEECKITNKKQQVCALTGCAALLLKVNAKTIHSWSGIKLARGPKSQIIANVLKNKYAIRNWKSISVLIIDEVSMLSQKIFEILEEIGREMRKSSKPFGGIQVIMSGDFFQLPPVPTVNEPETGKFCFESPKWDIVFPKRNIVEFKKIFRQVDNKFIEILMEIRRGNISEENAKILEKYTNRQLLEDNKSCVPTKLFPVRSKVDLINKQMYDKIDSPEKSFELVYKKNCKCYLDSGEEIPYRIMEKCLDLTDKEIEIETEILKTSINCSETLKLKVGTIVMCTYNIDLDIGICNGSQGVVVDFVKTVIDNGREIDKPIVRFYNGVTMGIPIQWWQSEDYPTIAVGIYPLCHAWALTIHKIQGATLDMAEIDIGKSIFECGQSYVALSRIRGLDGLFISEFNPKKIKANQKVVDFYNNIQEITPELMEEEIGVIKKEELEEETYDEPVIDETIKRIKIYK